MNTNIAIFVPHSGCPHQCSFCDQRSISGAMKPPKPGEVRELLEKSMKSLGERIRSTQIAFFGGSFTAIPRDYRRSLLEAARPYIGEKKFRGIRISTRPDCIDAAILEELAEYGVEAIELGCQSMDNEVLAANRRGHRAEDVERASRLIQTYGLSLGHQMMTGLYGSTKKDDFETARHLAILKPDTMRIYPSMILRGTEFARLYEAGVYTPPLLEEAVETCAALLEFFEEQKISVIRLGLQDEWSLRENLVAGPYHPAFRELCEGQLMLRRAFFEMEQKGIVSGRVRLSVNPRYISRMAGHGRRNVAELERCGYTVRILGDASVPPLAVTGLKLDTICD